MKPKISCLSPCYKMQDYLRKFLWELPNQTIFDDIEVVLDLNEPTEEELVLVNAFMKLHPRRLKVMIKPKVVPIGVSMNECIDEASADLVAIWNIDDLRTPDSLEKQAQRFYDRPHCGVVHGNFVIVKQFGGFMGKHVSHDRANYDTPEELTRSMILGPFFGFRKSLVNEVGMFDEQLKTGADFDMAIRLAAKSEVEMVDGILGYYLDEGKGASTKGDGRQPIERTVCELRYGILDKLECALVPEAMKYDLRHIVNGGKKIALKDVVRDYEDLQRKNDLRQ